MKKYKVHGKMRGVVISQNVKTKVKERNEESLL